MWALYIGYKPLISKEFMNKEEMKQKIEAMRPEYIQNLIELATSGFSSANTVVQSVRTLESIYRSLDDMEDFETEEEKCVTKIINIG